MLRIKSILFKYLARRFFLAFAIVFVCFFFIASLLEGMEVIRRASYGYFVPNIALLQLIFFKTIATLSLFFPFIVFIATILFYILINNKLELISIRIFAVSPLKIIGKVLLISFSLSSFYISVFDSISALSVDKVRKIEQLVFKKKDLSEITITNSGIWFKDQNKNNSYIIYTKAFDRTYNSLLNPRFFQFDKQKNFKRSIHAHLAVIQEGYWHISHAQVIKASGKQEEQELIQIPTKLSLRSVDQMTTDPKSISVWSLSKYINMLEKVGLSTLRYKLQLFVQLSSIILTLAFVLLASVFCLNYNSRNLKEYSLKVASALILAFPIYFFNNVFIAFGANETIPPLMATLAFPALLFCLFGLLSKKEF